VSDAAHALPTGSMLICSARLAGQLRASTHQCVQSVAEPRVCTIKNQLHNIKHHTHASVMLNI
jgi:hypothetical protein